MKTAKIDVIFTWSFCQTRCMHNVLCIGGAKFVCVCNEIRKCRTQIL